MTENDLILIAILVRNKAHILKEYLKSIENYDYPKKNIVVYINTNNNKDNSEEILEKWVKDNESLYKKIELDIHNFESLKKDKREHHSWDNLKLRKIAQIRQKSLEKAIEYKCDFYFTADVDNFILPYTLKELIKYDKPIIAPMLKCFPEKGDIRSNFYFDKGNGYYKKSYKYDLIFHREIKGLIEIPVVHCTYLIKASFISKLSYFDNEGDNWEFIKLMRNARKKGIKRYILNDQEYGIMFQIMNNKLSLEDEKCKFEKNKYQLEKYFNENLK